MTVYDDVKKIKSKITRSVCEHLLDTKDQILKESMDAQLELQALRNKLEDIEWKLARVLNAKERDDASRMRMRQLGG